jgi:hypothetical protein
MRIDTDDDGPGADAVARAIAAARRRRTRGSDRRGVVAPGRDLAPADREGSPPPAAFLLAPVNEK